MKYFYFIVHDYLRVRLRYKGCRVKHAKRFVEFKTFPYTQVNPVVCKVQLIDRVSASWSAHITPFVGSPITGHNRQITGKYKINYRRYTGDHPDVPFLLTTGFHCNYFPTDPYSAGTAPGQINIALAVSISKRSEPVFAQGVYLPRFS